MTWKILSCAERYCHFNLYHLKYINMKLLLSILISIACANIYGQELSDFESFDGTKIAYLDEGKGDPVILIHGFISNGSSWYGTELKRQLISNGYRVIVPDLRGNGQSDIPQNESAYKNDAEVQDLQLLMNHIGVSKYIAVGYSRGSIVLAKLLTKDERISKAVLGGMGIDFTKKKWDRRIMFMHAFLGTQPLNDDTKGAVEYASSINADLKVLGWLQKYQPVTSKLKLHQVDVPVLVIAGDQDLDNGDPDKLAHCLKNGQLEIVPGDHNTTYRKSPFADAVMKYLGIFRSKPTKTNR